MSLLQRRYTKIHTFWKSDELLHPLLSKEPRVWELNSRSHRGWEVGAGEKGMERGSATDKIIRKCKCRITLIAVRWSTINYCYTWYAQTSIDMAFRYRCNTHVLRNYVQHLMIMRLVHGSHFISFFFLLCSISYVDAFVRQLHHTRTTSNGRYDTLNLKTLKSRAGLAVVQDSASVVLRGHTGFPRYFIRRVQRVRCYF